MDTKLFENYIALQNVGRKKEAKKAIEAFVQSFETLPEKELWVAKHLENLAMGGTGGIRHELYAGVIFPALLHCYQGQDPWSTMWLSKTIQNLFSAKYLWEKIEFKSELTLAQEAYKLDRQSSEIRACLLEILISGFEYCEHEWPAGLLCGPDGCSPLECDETLDEIELARTLDEENRLTGYLWSFEKKVQVYKLRLLSES
ncbi:MAG: hypothetical protein JKY20_05185 [Alphaproteobacteria bacterium]|nr:hypothetical protein [Alphaproteobacteria bacterium]